MVELDAHSWLVLPGADGARIEAFAHPPPEILAPTDPGAAQTTDQVTVTMPAGGRALTYLDGVQLPDPVVEGIDGDQVTITPAFAQGLPQGEHVVVVLVVPEDGQDAPWASVALPVTVP